MFVLLVVIVHLQFQGGGSDNSKVSSSENVKKFLAFMDDMGIPKFDVSDLEKVCSGYKCFKSIWINFMQYVISCQLICNQVIF